MNSHHILGIDIAKAKFDVALRLDNGKFKNKVCKNTSEGFDELLKWLDKQNVASVHVCMEATGIYWEALATYLAHKSIKVSVVNPAQIKAYGSSRLTRSKTDKMDAELIAEYCFKECPKVWQAPSASELALRALVHRLEALQQMVTQESNRLHVARDTIRDGIVKHLQWLNEEIKVVDQQIAQHIDQDPDLRDQRELLDSIPGVGKRTTAVILSYYANTERFDNARKAAAFAGLDPRHYESGSSVRARPKMSKMGHSFVRKSLYMPAIVALYKTSWGKQFYQRLKSAGKPNKLIIGAMMRKLLHVAFGVLKSKQRFDENLHGIENPQPA